MITGKQPQLLATKIVPPRGAAGLIDRPRLLGMTAQLEEKQLVVIKAAAGFGKTSLALAWAEHLRRNGNSVAWLALDSDDNEPTRFLFYVAHALRRACDGLGEAAISQISEFFFLLPVNTIVATLINELADSEDEIYLFLDDYHWITHPEIHDALSFLLQHAPTQFHLVLTARTEPPLPLAQLRAQNRLLEIDAAALRFDMDETSRFLENEKLGALDRSELRMLCAKTEGWPAVLRIIASTSSQPGQDFARYVRGLSSALRPIGAYLNEMLDGFHTTWFNS
jgi:LuxR family transcriptional regulator, maltose regulon positive regulatory protein